MRFGTQRELLYGRTILAVCLMASVFATVCGAADGPADVPSPSADSIVQQLVRANNRRAMALRGYSATRFYKLQYEGFAGNRNADMKVSASYIAPDKKD